MMKLTILVIGILLSLNLFGQELEYPYVSDLEGKSEVNKVILLKFAIPHGTDKPKLNETSIFLFDSKGRIFFTNYSSFLFDSLVYDSKDNLIESYRFSPERKTLESKYIMDFDPSNKLISKKLFDGKGNILSTYKLTKKTKEYNKYTKTFNDGLIRTSEYYYDSKGLKSKLIVSDNNSIILFETYEYGSNGKYAIIKHLDSKGNVVATTSYVYDKQDNLLVELKKNNGTGKIEYKYEYTYDKNSNKLTEKNSFPNGNVNEFKFEYFYDSKGNWIKQTVYRGSQKSDIYERKIEYR